MKKRGTRTRKSASVAKVGNYRHNSASSVIRPDVGVQPLFNKRKPPQRYRYDSSLSPALDWDGSNSAREHGEWLIACIEQASRLDPPHRFAEVQQFKDPSGRTIASVRGLQDAIDQLKRISKPFLNWAGKAERLSFEAPTLPLFIHERLSTQAILETIKGHERDKQLSLYDLFGDREHSPNDMLLRAYEHPNGWANRMILGDSLSVMNSLLQYEGMAGQVQMIYLDPPYGVKFGSNFQPFIRPKREIRHNNDEDMTREPEMVKAYRDTWEQGVHSYLTYLRDRLLLSRKLLTESGSVFVQIGEENVHLVRTMLDEIFGVANFVSLLSVFKTTTPRSLIDNNLFYIVWYAKEKELLKYRQLFVDKPCAEWARETEGGSWGVTINGIDRPLTPEEKNNTTLLPNDAKVYQLSGLTSAGESRDTKPFGFRGTDYYPGTGNHWKTSVEGLENLAKKGRIETRGGKPWFKKYHIDYPVKRLTNVWVDTSGKANERWYVVQTQNKVIERCLLMTTDPGDLVLDPTCGSGTTACVSEQWGRRWVTIDTSRVPLALARQRLLTAIFPYFELQDETRGPIGGFVYKQKQNRKGEEIGGIVPHVTLESIANDKPAKEEVLVDRPEVVRKITRVTGPFTFEATIPTALDLNGNGKKDATAEIAEDHRSFVERMLEVLRKSPILQIGHGKAVTFQNVRLPAKTLALSAEAIVLNGKANPVAIVFGPENGAISARLVFEAAKEANAKGYSHLYVIGFAIQPNARNCIEECEKAANIPATYVQATPDLMMGDLLKNMRSSQIFSVCGLPDVEVHEKKPKKKGEPATYQVELTGLDVFDPLTMKAERRKGNDVPAWFLDVDYNGMCFHVSQAFFPRTSAWDSLKRALKTTYDNSVWDHLSGTLSTPFEVGKHKQIAVKVIDDRGNELLVVKDLEGRKK
ncbi:site-specific DNA-methyltransferase [candidate division KSB1 bacterium]|nr:MAG: site-specific DNA-methyltransferase [candidate division KSB1 bacterium]MCE7944307.1 site-specific DNA-methyltransferase [Chlorobi bacterium CHB1]